MGCDYLDPIKGIGPKSALKLIKEQGGLKGVVKHLRAKFIRFALLLASQIMVNFRAAEKAAAAQSEDEESEDEPAPTSDVERPDGSDEEPKPKPKPKKGKGKGKGKGGVSIPEEWPWEEAKKIFTKPDVLPADEVDVRLDFYHILRSLIGFPF